MDKSGSAGLRKGSYHGLKVEVSVLGRLPRPGRMATEGKENPGWILKEGMVNTRYSPKTSCHDEELVCPTNFPLLSFLSGRKAHQSLGKLPLLQRKRWVEADMSMCLSEPFSRQDSLCDCEDCG